MVAIDEPMSMKKRDGATKSDFGIIEEETYKNRNLISVGLSIMDGASEKTSIPHANYKTGLQASSTQAVKENKRYKDDNKIDMDELNQFLNL